jgi:hypothetical protein
MITRAFLLALACATRLAHSGEIAQPINTWVKRSPLEGTPPSPRLGYEGACVWDSAHQVVIRSGESSSPVWFEREWKRFYQPFAAAWHQ